MNGATVLKVGLEHDVSSAIASRNLIAFNQASPDVRERILAGIEEMAIRIVGRGHLDLSLEAVEAAASLLWDSDPVNHGAFLTASAILLPFLLNSRREPASPLIAAAFPPVYRELQHDSTPNFLSFIFIFVDWDKCKIARRQLVDASLGSDWRVADIALAAARAGDAVRILRHLAREKGGKRAIETIERDLEQIPMPWRQQVRSAIREIDRNESHEAMKPV